MKTIIHNEMFYFVGLNKQCQPLSLKRWCCTLKIGTQEVMFWFNEMVSKVFMRQKVTFYGKSN